MIPNCLFYAEAENDGLLMVPVLSDSSPEPFPAHLMGEDFDDDDFEEDEDYEDVEDDDFDDEDEEEESEEEGFEEDEEE
jgi:hypothetical protein